MLMSDFKAMGTMSKLVYIPLWYFPILKSYNILYSIISILHVPGVQFKFLIVKLKNRNISI